MVNRGRGRVAFGSVVVSVLGMAWGCGDDPSSAVGGTGGVGTGGVGPNCGTSAEFPCTGGVSATGGASATGGQSSGGAASGGGVSSGGTTGSSGGSTAGTGASTSFGGGSSIQLCPGSSIVNLPIATFDECEMVGCAQAHCVPETAVPDKVPKELLGRCKDPTTLCIPDDYTATFGSFLAKSCTSILGAEGRCISKCVPQVNGLTDALPTDVCAANEKCAPCINPNDGKETGACSQGCDPGMSAETKSHPIVFPSCANGEGACAPKAIIPTALQSQLTQNTCPGADQLCCPTQKSQNLKYNFPKCTPSNPFVGILAPPGPNGQAGGCVPEWLADSNPFEGIFLAQDTCSTGQKCAPCNNPLRGGAATGSCPIPLPSDPSGGLPPDGSTGGTSSTGGTTGTGGATSTGGVTWSGGAASGGASGVP